MRSDNHDAKIGNRIAQEKKMTGWRLYSNDKISKRKEAALFHKHIQIEKAGYKKKDCGVQTDNSSRSNLKKLTS